MIPRRDLHVDSDGLTLTAAKSAFWTASDLELQSVDFGFRPSAVIAWWTRQAGCGAERPNRGGMGFWTAEESVSVAWFSADGERSARPSHLAEGVALVGLEGAEPEVTMRADIDSFDADGLTLRWRQRPSERWIVHCLALGGSSLERSRVGWLSLPLRAGRGASLGLPGMRPDLVLLVPTIAESGVVAQDLSIGIGAVSARGQAAAGYVCTTGAGPGVVTGAQRRAPTIDWPGDDGYPPRIGYLALEGIRATVGTDVSPSIPGTKRTSVGFRPDALLLFSWGLAGSRQTKKIGRFCLGGASGPASGCASWDDRNTEALETSTHVASSTEHALIVSDTQTGGIHARAALKSIDNGGFTLDWTESDGKARQFAYVALSHRKVGNPVRRALSSMLRVARAGRPF